jgi:hypothetical protein
MDGYIPLELEPDQLARYEPYHKRYMAMSPAPNIRLAATEQSDDDASYRHKVNVAVQEMNRKADEIVGN